MRFYYTSDKSISLVNTTYDKTYKKAINLGGGGSYNTYRSVELYVAPGTVKINTENSSSSERVMVVYINGVVSGEYTIAKSGATSVTFDVDKDSLIQFMSKSNGIKLCSVEYTPSAVPTEAPDEPLTVTAEKTVDESGSVHIDARLSRGVNATLYVAQYDETGALIALSLADTNEETLEYSFELGSQADSDIRLMLWDDMLPVCETFGL